MMQEQSTEIVLGVVSPVGTDLTFFKAKVDEQLKDIGYSVNLIRVSDFLKNLKNPGVTLKDSPEADRLNSYMTAGNEFRKLTKRAEILAIQVAAEISKKRKPTETPLYGVAHVLTTLKHPAEVRVLRRIYGPGFYLIGVYSPQAKRLEHLKTKKHIPASEAEKLIERDQFETDPFGQKTRDTFELADVFINVSSSRVEKDIERFLDLVFGGPFHTTTHDEHAMFMAYAASLRSADLSRQVGAVIASSNGEIIASGANDVPCFDGGQYWPDERDRRDYILGYDSNKKYRDEIVVDIMKAVKQGKDLDETKRAALLEEGNSLLNCTRLFSLTEFGRAVHAEMEALLSCARTGVSPKGGTLYTTTFPCHNCAKHIVASGIRRVVFVEPYPKSLAEPLHEDAIEISDTDDPPGQKSQKVLFQPFVGVGPRRFFDLFSMGLSTGREIKRKDKDGNKIDWVSAGAKPRVPMQPLTYMEMESLYTNELDKITEKHYGSGKEQRDERK